MESNAVLQLKAKNQKLKDELKAEKWKHVGYQEEAIQRKNMELNALRRVWCSGGCHGGVQLPVTAEMVAYVEQYAKRLAAWFVKHEGRRIREMGNWDASKWDEFMEHHHEIWGNAEEELTFARKKFEEIECQQ